MIVTEFYNGQGIGNQLWLYVVLRALAAKKGVAFGVQSPEKFKGNTIFDIDFGEIVQGGIGPEGGPPTALPENIDVYLKESPLYEEKTCLDVTPADPALLNIKDRTKFDGNCQSLKYLEGLEHLVPEWLKLKAAPSTGTKIDSETCVIHVRGGDFLNTYSFLPANYYKNAMNAILEIAPNAKFVAVTDDLKYCNKILPDVHVVGSTPLQKTDSFRASHHIGGSIADDFFILNQASYVILSSSTFSFWAALLNAKKAFVIAPKYWFAFSKSNGWWSTPEIIISGWHYLDKRGGVEKGADCLKSCRTPKSSQITKKSIIRSTIFRIQRRIARIGMR